MAHECVLILLLASLLDALVGDPRYPLHPVRLIGSAAGLLESGLRHLRLSGLVGGAVLVLAALGICLGTYLGVWIGLYHLHPRAGLCWSIFVVYSCISLRDLADHARPIADALERSDLSAARRTVQKIVGRDADQLDAHGVARAAVESVAEGFVDGVLSPLFWYVVGGMLAHGVGLAGCLGAVLGILWQRTINTMDSMVGYRNERYIRFGRTAARLDDALNFIPARLAALSLFAAAALCRLRPVEGLRVLWRDRLKHHSPNAGHPEAFVAGALDLRLGGPTIYSDGVLHKPWIGDGSSPVTAEHLRRCTGLIRCAGWLSVGVSLVVLTQVPG